MPMNKSKLRLMLGILSLILVVYVYWYSYRGINSLTEHFVEMEVTKEKFIVDLVTDNYNGITSITNKQKDTVISNLSDVSLVGSSIKTMRNAALFILHPTFSFYILFLIYVLVKTFREIRHNNTHQPTPKSGNKTTK